MSKKDIQYNENGICSYEYVEINGIKQYIQIRGAGKDNPVLLVIHGGPGGALSGLAHAMQSEWEQKLTVVNFDQRNSGKTYVANRHNKMEIAKTGTIEDYIKDVNEIISYLHTKLDFKKIYLMGFSWGSVIGAEYVKKYPQNIFAYIGVGQLVSFERGYKLICNKALSRAKEENNAKDVTRLQRLIDEYPAEHEMTKERMQSVRTFAMLANKYFVKNAKAFPVGAILSSPFMSFKEKKAMLLTNANLYTETYRTMFKYDFTHNMRFEVPVYFITGDEDINCPGELVNEKMCNLEAPEKRFITLEKASHMCFYDNMDKFNQVLFDIITKADKISYN